METKAQSVPTATTKKKGKPLLPKVPMGSAKKKKLPVRLGGI